MGVLELFFILIQVADQNKRNMVSIVAVFLLTFVRNTTEGFKNCTFTNMEMVLWARLLLNHISVVSPGVSMKTLTQVNCLSLFFVFFSMKETTFSFLLMALSMG